MNRTRKPTIWTTRDGEEIPVRELSDSHLTNIVKLLARGAENFKFKLCQEAETFEMFLQGEIASLEASRATDRVHETPAEELLIAHVPQYKNLLKEARRRKLPDPQVVRAYQLLDFIDS